MIVIDHHIFEKNLNSERVVHINPRFKKETYLPTSYLVYRILENLGKEIKPFIWIAVTGIIGDYDVRECKDVMEECKKKPISENALHWQRSCSGYSRISDGRHGVTLPTSCRPAISSISTG